MATTDTELQPLATRTNAWAHLRSLDEALDHLRAELSSLATCSEALQDAIGALPLRAPPSGKIMRRVQAADLLTQRLHALTQFAEALRCAAPSDWLLADNWCSAAPVGVQRHARVAAYDDEHAPFGDCELF